MTWLIPAGAVAAFAAVTLGLVADGAVPPALALHAGLMITAWNVLLPAGAIVARYFKVTRGQDFPAVLDNQYWWVWHRRCQYGGVVLATLGLAAVAAETGWAPRTTHSWLGLAILAVGWLQVLSGHLRGSKGGPTDPAADPCRPATWRGDHYDMTPRRRLFEFVHKGAGWTVIALACVTALTGSVLVGAPTWLLLLLGGLHGAILLALVDGAARRRWVDTYRAIWGVLPPAGPGRRRRRPAEGADEAVNGRLGLFNTGLTPNLEEKRP